MSIIHRRTIRVGISVAAAATLALSLPLTFAAADDDAISCLEAGNVWVVVQLGDDVLADGCATEFDTGFQALDSAGIEYAQTGGFISTIQGEPADPGPEDWWSYWTGSPADDNSVEWTSYMVGAAESAPQPGTIEGWRLATSWTEQAPPPAFPDLTPSQTVSPEPSTSDEPTTSPEPSTPAGPSASPEPSVTATPTTTNPTSPGLPGSGV